MSQHPKTFLCTLLIKIVTQLNFPAFEEQYLVIDTYFLKICGMLFTILMQDNDCFLINAFYSETIHLTNMHQFFKQKLVVDHSLKC